MNRLRAFIQGQSFSARFSYCNFVFSKVKRCRESRFLFVACENIQQDPGDHFDIPMSEQNAQRLHELRLK